MKRITNAVLVGTLAVFSQLAIAQSGSSKVQAELNRINNEEAKINDYIKQGADPALFSSQIEDLKAQRKKLASVKTVTKSPALNRKPAGNIAIQKRIPERVAKPVSAPPPAEAPKAAVAPEATPAQVTQPAAPPVATVLPTANDEFRLGFMFDGYYSYVSGGTQPGAAIPYRFYDANHNDFTVNLIELNASGKFGRMSYRVDLDFGDFAELNTTDTVSKHLGQASVTYDFGETKPITLTAGKIYTHVGFEVAKAYENINYSRAFTFSQGGPFWHEGLALNGELESGIVFGAYLYDRWDGRLDQNSGKTLGWRLGFKGQNASVYYNGIVGPEQTAQNQNKKMVNEVNASWTVNDNLTLAADALVGHDQNALGAGANSEWWSVVGYAKWNLATDISLSPRIEYFRDSRGGIFATPTGVLATTMTAAFKPHKNVELRVEGRMDSAADPVFVKADGVGAKARYFFTTSILLNY
jgi:hypothetical protein